MDLNTNTCTFSTDKKHLRLHKDMCKEHACNDNQVVTWITESVRLALRFVSVLCLTSILHHYTVSHIHLDFSLADKQMVSHYYIK